MDFSARRFAPRSKNIFYVMLLFALCFLFFLPFLISPNFLTNKDNDLGRTYYPLFSFFKKSVLYYHQIPVWRPDQMMGQTFIGDPLSSLFYPANIIFIVLPIALASVVYYLLHFLIAAIITFFLAKSFSLSKIASFAAAIFYAFSLKMLMHLTAGHITMIAAFSYFPLIFLGVRKIIAKPNLIWTALTSVCLTFSYITYPTIFYYTVIFIGVYWMYKFFDNLFNSHFTRTINGLAKFFTPLFIIIVLSLLLSAIELIPQLEFGPLSTRSSLTLADVAVPVWSAKRFLTSLFFPYLNLKSFDHESLLYLGIVPSVLSITGFFYLPKFKKFFLLSASALSILFVIGSYTPFFPILYKVLPLLRYSRVTTRIWFAVALVAALLSSYAIDKLKIKKSAIIVIITIFIFESIFITGQKFAQTPNLSFANESLYKFIAKDNDIFRVYCTTYCFNPQLLYKYNIQILNGETPIQDKSFINFLAAAGGYSYNNFAVIFPPYQVWQVQNPPIPNSALLGFANVKYVASTYPINNPDLEPAGKFKDIYFYRNMQFRPRVYFTRSNDKITITKITPNIVSLSFVPSSQKRNLVFAENYYPGWNVQKSDPVFRQIVVPANSNQVELKYEPKSFILGRTITIATIFFLSLFIFRKQWQKSRS